MITRLKSHLDILKQTAITVLLLICCFFVTSCAVQEVTLPVGQAPEEVDITFKGGSGKAHVESPVKITYKDGTAYATLIWSSENYDYIIAGGRKYENENPGGPSTFTVPVESFDEPFEFIGDTLAMSQPHEIEYKIIWNTDDTDTEDGTADTDDTEQERLFGIRSDTAPSKIGGTAQTGRLELVHATGFDIREYGMYKYISIYGVGDYLLVPEGMDVPSDIEDNVTIINMPVDKTYLVSTSAMDLVSAVGALDDIGFCALTKDRWFLDGPRERMSSGKMLYAGKYRAPDYELILSHGCDLAIENTMIFHNPEVKEKLEELGIPVIVETSSYESDPLGRLEWIKLYGTLFGKEEEAKDLYEKESARIESVTAEAATDRSIAFFSVSAAGMINTRRPNDYIAKMIRMAGCRYLPASGNGSDEGASGTFNMQAEDFYAEARDADILIYNSTIDGELSTVEDLIAKNHIFADFSAVREGRVYCLTSDFFQKTTGMADFITDITKIAKDSDECTFLTRLR